MCSVFEFEVMISCDFDIQVESGSAMGYPLCLSYLSS